MSTRRRTVEGGGRGGGPISLRPAPLPVPLLLLTVAAALLGAGCRQEPAEVRGYRNSMELATAVLDRDDPAAAQELRRCTEAAERLTAEHAGRQPILDAWADCLSFADQALEPPDPQEELAARWPEIQALARNRLEQVEDHLAETSAGRDLAREATRARMRLAAARRHAAAGRLARATLEAEAALAHLTEGSSFRAERLSRFGDPTNLETWQAMVGSALARAGRSKVIVVDKLRRRLSLFRSGREIASFSAELGTNGLAPKYREGDAATPEGVYRIVDKKKGAETRYYKALLLDYPNEQDRRRFAARQAIGKLPPEARIGGLIEIHGEGGVGRDWTDGCVALDNDDMDALYRQVDEGTTVVIVGTY